jgi:hypothetical protein
MSKITQIYTPRAHFQTASLHPTVQATVGVRGYLGCGVHRDAHLFSIEKTERILSVGPTAGVDMYYTVYNGAELTEIG